MLSTPWIVLLQLKHCRMGGARSDPGISSLPFIPVIGPLKWLSKLPYQIPEHASRPLAIQQDLMLVLAFSQRQWYEDDSKEKQQQLLNGAKDI